jgi:prepilin-type N-terminal cleavage/methylation domain-containing protein
VGTFLDALAGGLMDIRNGNEMKPGLNRTTWPGCRRRGYSLTEMLVVIIVIGVVSAMAIPNMTNTMGTARADRAATVVKNDVQSAFSLAARQRKPVEIVLNTSNQSYTVRDRATSTVLFTRMLGGGESPYGVTGLSGTSTTVTLFPNGLAQGAFTIRITIGNSTRRIVVSRAGLIRVTM